MDAKILAAVPTSRSPSLQSWDLNCKQLHLWNLQLPALSGLLQRPKQEASRSQVHNGSTWLFFSSSVSFCGFAKRRQLRHCSERRRICRCCSDNDADVERSKVLFVGGVPQELSSETVIEHLGQYGAVKLVKRCRGYLYAKFSDQTTAKQLLSQGHTAASGFNLTLQAPTATKKTWYNKIDPAFPVRVRRLGDGIVHIQNMLSFERQQELARQVLDLGCGKSGGFYTPTFESGKKLRLHMFCLGKHWNHRTRTYSRTRDDFDDAKVLQLPDSLKSLALGIQSDLRQKCGESLFPEPDMCPDICVINHYGDAGALGLHQDKDESQESLERGSPVISISLGQTARFCYATASRSEEEGNYDQKSLLLRSGDIFIFGGPSRMLHHGIADILPNSAPRKLQTAMLAKPGRLSLTFRQF
eukprot:TRINITY_DN17776_c0_g1_i2.p1 TRINITY_DN17776_c0_g1~~TRINITY_DN17776_c0_g1_i2.p1  ORF type:complete len:414 (+),score=56.13 TRINITY_DN17776_c0_g1_i2:56-1297(+)